MSDENNKRKTRAALVFLLLLEENRGEKMNIGTNKIYDDFASSVEKIFFDKCDCITDKKQGVRYNKRIISFV